MSPRRNTHLAIGAIAVLAYTTNLLIALLGGSIACADEFARTHELSPLVPAPPLDARKVWLGRQLFHDPIMSRKQMIACSSCHDLSTGGTVRLRRPVGYEGREHTFNAPSIFNVSKNYRFGWKGTTTSLTEQNLNVLLDPNLMGNTWELLLPRLNGSRKYRGKFETAYGRSADAESVLDALVTFQQSLVTPDAPFDLYLRGDPDAISAQQKYGYRLFREYGCVSCHQGSNVGGNMFQVFGVFGDPDSKNPMMASDVEARIDTHDKDTEMFRVPSLRNVALTAPYFHDGRTDTLRDAISVMARSQLGRDLPSSDIAAIESFLDSLTGTYDGKPLSNAAEGRR